MSSCRINRLLLDNFRNFSNLDISISDSQFVVLHGKNGSGKTNILEAISMLTNSRGIRSASIGDISNINGNSNWVVFADCEDYKISTAYNTEKRIYRQDGQNSSLAKATDLLPIFFLSPQQDATLSSNRQKREMLDRIVANFYPEHSKYLNLYDKTRQERQAILSNSNDDIWLSRVERKLTEYSAVIASNRIEVINIINNTQLDIIGELPIAELSISDSVDNIFIAKSATAAEQELQNLYKDNRNLDRQQGRASVGIHKTILTVKYNNMEAQFCSTGEQKSLMIYIILVAIKAFCSWSGKKPIILLDEITSHLDEKRRNSLLQTIAVLNCQTFVTGTEADLFDSISNNSSIINVEDL